MQRLKATLMMVAASFVMAAFTTSYKLAAADGMHMRVLITYRYLFASILIFPLALFLERHRRQKLTWTIVFQVFLCVTFGGPISQNMYAKSLILTSTTFTAAFTNLIPPLTFIIAVLFRSEKLEIGKNSGKVKVIGTLIGVGGAMILTFYKGHQLNIKSPHFNLLHFGHRKDGLVAVAHDTSSHDHIFGSLLALAYSLFIAFYYIIQGKVSVIYPCHYSNTFLFSVIGFIQSLVYAVLTERSLHEWKLTSNIRLFAAIIQGICSLLAVFLVMATVYLQGPLFVSIFNPLGLVLVAIAGFLLLEEKLYVGSVLGSIIVIVGLYLVLWGKSNETKRLSWIATSGGSKDVNATSNTITTVAVSETVSIAHNSFAGDLNERGEPHGKLPMKKNNEQEVIEDV